MGVQGCAVLWLRSRRRDVHARESSTVDRGDTEEVERTVIHQAGDGGLLHVRPQPPDSQTGPGG